MCEVRKAATGLNPMKRRTLKPMLPHKINNPDVSFWGEAKVVDREGSNAPFSLSMPSDANRVNDPIDSQCVSVQRLDCCVKKTVYCSVVSPVHFVTDTGQSQKNYLSPELIKKSIKFVKVVCFESHFPSAPPVINVHSVVEIHPVGGRLQTFGTHGSPWVQIQG